MVVTTEVIQLRTPTEETPETGNGNAEETGNGNAEETGNGNAEENGEGEELVSTS